MNKTKQTPVANKRDLEEAVSLGCALSLWAGSMAPEGQVGWLECLPQVLGSASVLVPCLSSTLSVSLSPSPITVPWQGELASLRLCLAQRKEGKEGERGEKMEDGWAARHSIRSQLTRCKLI